MHSYSYPHWVVVGIVIVLLGSGLVSFGRDTDSRVNPLRGEDWNRFQKAYALIQESKFRPALQLLQQNIKEKPDASSYEYGWGCLCAAQLGDIDLALEYYEVICMRGYGDLSLGADGSYRNESFMLTLARRAIAASNSPRRAEALRKMDELAELGHKAAVTRVKDLVRKTGQGDEIARQDLSRSSHVVILVDLLASGELRLSDTRQ